MCDENENKVGLIGIGRMGSGIGSCLLQAGYQLIVHDVRREAANPLVKEGAVWAKSPYDLAKEVSVVLLSLPTTEIVEEVLFGETGMYGSILPGTVVVDMSTISPVATKALALKLRSIGVEMLDAPVSGGSEGARNGSLSAMVGGKRNVLEKVLPILNVITKSVTHVGDNGAGQAVKMVNQVVLVGNVMAMSEGILLAKQYGLELESTLTAIQGGAAGSWMLSNLAPKVIQSDWTPSFTIELQLKDLRIALNTADELGVPLISTSQIFQLYRSLAVRGKDQDGNHSLIQALYALMEVGD